jgi:signal transduction histidine kinase/CheY-like chemotaxis protein
LSKDAPSESAVRVLVVGCDGLPGSVRPSIADRFAAAAAPCGDGPVSVASSATLEEALARVADIPVDLVVTCGTPSPEQLARLRDAALGADVVMVGAPGALPAHAAEAHDTYAPDEFADPRTVRHLLHHAARRRRVHATGEARRALEARLQHMQKLESLAVLAGGVAHDFNNLLMVIMGNASLALLELDPDSPARASIEQVEQSARKAAELTNQMLAFAGGGAIRPQPLDLARLVAETRSLVAAAVPPGAEVAYEEKASLAPVRADGGHVRQVLLNLVQNAVESLGGRGGRVTVRTGEMDADRAYLAASYIDEQLPPGRYVYLEVADTGVGIDEATKVRLFDPFFTTKFTGRGLGLAAVLGIVRAHRGAIHVDSARGRGSTFRVLFPAAPGVAAVEPPVANVRPGGPHGTVLVVDDDELVRHVTRTLLQRAGYTVEIAADGDVGAEMFAQRPNAFDVVLLDLTMPRVGGLEAFRRMRDVRADARVVLSSGYSEDHATERFPANSLAGFLHKPYQASQLLAAIQQALGGQRVVANGDGDAPPAR